MEKEVVRLTNEASFMALNDMWAGDYEKVITQDHLLVALSGYGETHALIKGLIERGTSGVLNT